MSITGTVPISDIIAPTSELDIYPVTDPGYGLGGLRTVGTTADRDAITVPRRQVGMVVYVSSINKYYNLVGGTANTDWEEFSLGVAGAGATGATGATGERGERGERGETGDPGIAPTDYVESLNSLTGPLQISAGDFVQIEIVGGNTLKITALEATFDSDITASFSQDKSFGKYTYGQRVPAANKTAREVIREALLDSLPPFLTISSPSTVQFNQTSISNRINVTHQIQTIGATGASGYIEWRRNNAGAWERIGVDLFNPLGTFFSGGITHTTSIPNFDSPKPFNYRYVVIDSRGASAQIDTSVTHAAYVAPIVDPYTQQAVDVQTVRGVAVDSNLRREKGNSRTRISGTAVQRSSLVNLTAWGIEYSQNGGAWTSLVTGSFSSPPYSIPEYIHNPTTAASLNQIQYRIRIWDTLFTSGQIVNTNPQASAITFHNLVWYGPTSGVPTTSDHFVIAMPAPSVRTSVKDETQNLDLTNAFVTGNASWNGLNLVNDFAGNSTNYNVYAATISEPYRDPVIIRVTRNPA
jgi:hypothetical protein